MIELFELIEKTSDSVNIAVKNKLVDKNLRMYAKVKIINALIRLSSKSYELSNINQRKLSQLNGLVEKNRQVFENGLMNESEYDKNNLTLLNSILKIVAITTEHETTKMSKIDLYSLRAHMNNLNNEN